MPSSLTKIWIHAFFSTKDRVPLIQPAFALSLHSHIKQHMEHDLLCYVQTINGESDHIHLLYLLNPNFAVKDILKNVKGESSHWINGLDFLESKFAWQKAYTAVSVSDTMVKAVERHIEQQKEYHRTATYIEEQRRFFTLHRMQFKRLTD